VEKVNLRFGLDIGVASVGWAVLGSTRIIDLGVRCFDKAETAKEGESLNLARRQARLLRRRLYRRAWRLTQVARLLKREGLIDSVNFFKQQPGFSQPDPKDTRGKKQVATNTWVLRKEGLDRLLTPIEWARVIYHLCKHRGFHWVSKAEEVAADADVKSEGGRVKKSLADTAARMNEKRYRTAAEMVLSEFPDAQRNKRGDYSKALSRKLLDEEFQLLFETQRRLKNPHASEALEALIRGTGDRKSGLFWKQKPTLSGANLLKMLGRCTFERVGGTDGKGELRAPKASFTAERHVWLTRLNNLRVVVDGISRPLNESERQVALNLPYQSSEKFTYKNLRTALLRTGLHENFRFGGLAYPSYTQKEEEKAKHPEEQILVKLTAWHTLRLAMKNADLQDTWQQISKPALDGHPDTLDQIGWVLSVYKEDDEVSSQLRQLDLPQSEQTVSVLLGVRFDKFHALSLKALRQIVPHMERGLRYDEAVAKIPEYGHHSQRKPPANGQTLYLPPFYENQRQYQGKSDRVGSMVFRQDIDVPRNPVVLRALNQARKVVNALIKQYGSPTAVHIEMARDLSRPLDERREIQKLQEEFKERNQKAREDFEAQFHRKPNSKDFKKWMLYREQGGQCAYSLQPLAPSGDCNEIFLEGKTQIDHALPYSRSFDDSKNNKVLLLTRENQNKGNRTAYEYLTSFTGGEDGVRWRSFVAWVNQNKTYRAAKRNRLLRKNYGADEARGFKDRNLNDTRYICKFFKNYVEENLLLASKEDGETNQRCVVVSGQLTAFLRARWGLHKVSEENDRHHALDAAVVAACSHSMVKALADYSRFKEIEFLKEGFPDPETGEILNPTALDRGRHHFPEPWAHFRHELEARLKTDNLVTLRENMQRLGTYSEIDLQQLRTLFVSRAPQRLNGGAVHKDTIYAQPERLQAQGGVVQKVPLTSLTLKDLDKLADPHRNAKLYDAIRERLEIHDGKADKAFGPDNPFYKPGKDGQANGPVVRTVKLVIDKLSGIPLRGGMAKNDSMIRVDVFTKAGKFHLVPIYVHHRVTGLPNRAIVASKDEDEDEWTLIDKSFSFLFSVYPNDLVRVTLKKGNKFGYYSSCNRATGSIDLWLHDRAKSTGKDGLIQSIGVKMALNFEKFNVDLLGNIYHAPLEQRRDLA
jgi:CRISPR-associated endonuclease Csn1